MSCKRSTIYEQQLPFYLQNSFRTIAFVRGKLNALSVADKYSHKIEVQIYKSTDIYKLVCPQMFATAQCTQRHAYRPLCTGCLAPMPHRFPEVKPLYPLTCRSKINLHRKPDNFQLFLSHPVLHNEDLCLFQIFLLY